jgi:hypothetical protein
VNVVARSSSESFDENERPTAQRSRPEGGDDPNATTRIKPFDLEQLVAKGSGTRPVITSEQIDRYMKERTAEDVPGEELGPLGRPTASEPDIRERETVDALTLQRETLIIKPSENVASVQATAQQIPIDVDLSRLHLPTPRPAAGRPVPFTTRIAARLDQRQLTIAAGFLIAMISALLGFIAGRL